MPEHQMTGREFAALCFRILGVVILLTGLAQSLFMVAGLGGGDASLWIFAKLMGLVVSVLLFAIVALPLIFRADAIAAWLFPEPTPTIAFGVSGRDLFRCGLALVGVWLLAGHLPYLARLGGELLWSAEAGRRAQLPEGFFKRGAFEALDSFLACVAGWLVFRYAGEITSWWEGKAAADP